MQAAYRIPEAAMRLLTGVTEGECVRPFGTYVLYHVAWLMAGGAAVITDHEARHVHRLEVR